MLETKISWAHATWNPWSGCDWVSRECDGCYAKAQLELHGRNFSVLAPTQTFRTPYLLNAEAEGQNKQAICFVCSLSDFFHLKADHWRDEAWQIIKDCKHVNFMLLTKRPERIAECLPDDWANQEQYKNVWLGTTCGVRTSFDRLEILRSIPCSLRFLSIEPLMESIADIDLTGIGWVAVGGMSGRLNQARHLQLQWAAEVHDLCKEKGIPFLFKQSSNLQPEHGINGLSLYLAEREGNQAAPETVPLLRSFPTTNPPLLPFVEHGKRFREEEYRDYMRLDSGSPKETRAPKR